MAFSMIFLIALNKLLLSPLIYIRFFVGISGCRKMPLSDAIGINLRCPKMVAVQVSQDYSINITGANIYSTE